MLFYPYNHRLDSPHKTIHNTSLESHFLEKYSRGDSHYKVGDIKCKGDKIGFEMCQFTGYAEVWNQYGIDPRHKSEDKEHPCQNCN